MFVCNLCEDGDSDVVLAGLINKYGKLVKRQRPAEKHLRLHTQSANIVRFQCHLNWEYENSRSDSLLSGLWR